MKKLLRLFCDAAGLIVLAAVLVASPVTFAAPVDSRANKCTIVDAVVSARSVFGTGNVAGKRAEGSVGSDRDSVDQERAFRVPAAVADVSSCGVVHFSTATGSLNGMQEDHATAQNFLRMATIFEDRYADFDLISIFAFRQPTVRVTSTGDNS